MSTSEESIPKDSSSDDAAPEDSTPESVAPVNKNFFISHASEDKGFVKQLVDTAQRAGLSVWYDDYEIIPGQSIRGKINEGLISSKYGVIVLSPNFFAKDWPKQELAALALLLQGTENLIPVFLDMSPKDLLSKEPLLADIKGLFAASGYAEVASQLAAIAHGPVETDARGWRNYRNKTVRIVDLPMDAENHLRRVRFESCVIQGPVVLMMGDNISLISCVFNGPNVFWEVREDRGYVGAVGIDNVEFIGCRFKDVGVTTTLQQTLALLKAGPAAIIHSLPDRLQ